MNTYIKRQDSIKALEVNFLSPDGLWKTLQQIELISGFRLIYNFGDKYPFLEIDVKQDTLRFEQGDFICFDKQELRIFKMSNEDFHEHWVKL